MTHLLELHKEKKHFLNEFMALNAREISNFANGNFEGLNQFYHRRESILEILQFIEEKIALQIENPDLPSLNLTEKKMLESAVNEIHKLAQEIVKQDMDLLSLIDGTKSAIIKELQNLKRNKKGVGSYKTKVDHHQIDEEA